jgi:hypothetical protein
MGASSRTCHIPRKIPDARQLCHLGSRPLHSPCVSQLHLEVDSLFEKFSLTRQNAQVHQLSYQILCHFGQGKDGRSMIVNKGPLHSIPGNLIRGTDAPDMEGVLMKFPTHQKIVWL